MKRRILLIALALIVIAAALFGVRRVLQRPDADSLVLSGTIEAADVELSFRIPGRIAERALSEGEPTRAGAIVARLDETELRHQAELAAAERDASRAALAELEAGTRAEEIAQAASVARAAEAESERALSEETRARQLFADDVISRRELETAQANARTAVERAREASQRLALLRSGPRPETIDQARARLRQAEANLSALETRLSYAILRSPIDGVALADHAEPGEQVAAGTPVLTVADLSKVWLRAFVDETDLGRIRLGMPVSVRTDTFPDKRYDGRIAFIAADAEFTPKSVQTEKERVKLVYRVKVDVANSGFELKPGMPADAEVALAPADATSGS
jgi:HlyD family secretion protein